MIVSEDQQARLVCKGWDAVKKQPYKKIFMDRVASLDCKLRYHALLESDKWKLNFPQIRKKLRDNFTENNKWNTFVCCGSNITTICYEYFICPDIYFSKNNLGWVDNFLKYFSLFFISKNILWISLYVCEIYMNGFRHLYCK